VDPLSRAIEDPTWVLPLAPGSPAIDAIPTSSGLCPATDQRGVARPDDSESFCDIGAYESDYTLQPTSLSAVSGSGTYGGAATLTATLTSGTTPVSGKTISFSLNGTAVCGGSTGVSCPTTTSSGVATLTGVSLTGITAGTSSGAVGASVAGDSAYSSSSSSGDLTVAQASQIVTFGTLSTHTYGDAPFSVSATASSGLPVSFTVGSTDQCTISGNTVTITGAGSCTVTASQVGNANYSPATSVSQTFSIAKAAATITLVQSSLSATYDGKPHLATATTTPTGLSSSVSYTDSSNTPVTSPTNAGTYSVTASITDPNYQGSTTGTLVISKAGQAITVTTPAPASAAYGATFTVAATTSSGLSVAYGSSGSCSNSGALFTMTSGTSTCTVTLDQAGNSNYKAAQEVTETVSAQKATTTTTVTSSVNPSIVKQGVTFTVKVTSGAGTPGGTVTIKDGATTLASGITLDPTGSASFTTTTLSAGTHGITASYGGNTNFSGSATGSPLGQQVRYTVNVLSTANRTVVLQLQDFANTNVSASTLTVTAVCVVASTTPPPTTCGSTPLQSINTAFLSINKRGSPPSYSYSISRQGLIKGQQYDLLVQAGADPIYHVVQFTA
jgi:hypothetical protein